MTEIAVRSSAKYKNLSEKFSQVNNDFTKQYCSIYTARLQTVRPHLEKKAEKLWGLDFEIVKLHELSGNSSAKCIVIGTLFKDQKLKPSVIKQLAEANQLVPQPIVNMFTDESDTLHIEDEVQRFLLLGALKGDNLVTGIPCALLGTDMGKGKFMVHDYCFAGIKPQIEKPLLTDDAYVVFVSGLDLKRIERNLISIQLFVDWISGLLGDLNGVEIAKVVRLVIAGNSVNSRTNLNQSVISMVWKSSEEPDCVEAVKLFDTVLAQLSQLLDVDVMPGQHDPSNHILPQKPMNHCMFPASRVFKTLNLVSNPYKCELEGLNVLGSSGQPIRDVMMYSELKDPIEVLESLLSWSHLAPTAPDTLGCFPFYNQDPFIIEECPHVFFAGNQEKFATKLSPGQSGQEIRLICVPEFYSSHTVAVVNLKNLDCFPISFRSS